MPRLCPSAFNSRAYSILSVGWATGRPAGLASGGLGDGAGVGGTFGGSIASPRDPLVERLQRGPRWLRRQVTRIPDRLQPAPRRAVRVQAYDPERRLVHDLPIDDTECRGLYHIVTGVREHDGRIWMGSRYEAAVAVLEP